MRFFRTTCAAFFLGWPYSHAQKTTDIPSTDHSLTVQANSLKAPIARKSRPLSTGAEWTALLDRNEDLPQRHRHVLGSLYLFIGAVGLAGGTLGAIGAHEVFSTQSDSELDGALKVSFGSFIVAGAITFLVGGVVMTIRGIRILQGKNASVGWAHVSFPRLPPASLSQHGPPGITISL